MPQDTDTGLHVRSNVRRDLLQNSQQFKNAKLVTWEYVSNALQYVDPGVAPDVMVDINSRGKTITIADNGRGMDLSGLQNFFIMHGENLDRLAGHAGRGRFGTGKSAAFGIGRSLKVTSVRNGMRNSVQLTRDEIDSAGDDVIPIQIVEQDVPTDDSNGTIVVISNIQQKKLDQPSIIRFVEQHLRRWPGRPTVTINTHRCEAYEPPVSRTVVRKPDGDTASSIGDGPLILKVSTGPLDTEFQGVAVFAGPVWLTQTLAGAAGQPMANYIFGQIDVPALDDESAPIAAFDVSRSMELNPENHVVQSLIPFLGREIDALRRELVKEDRARRAQADVQRLQEEADEIASLINEDFSEFRSRLQRMRSRGGRGRDNADVFGDEGESDLLRPSTEGQPGTSTDRSGGPGDGDGDGGSGGGSDAGQMLIADQDGEEKGKPASASKRRKPSGGFRVEFDNLGTDEPRARYAREERVIYINLDHRQINAAKGDEGINSVNFRRLSYEVAFTEYSIALTSELLSVGDFYEPSDAIFEIRETINRMAVRAAALYIDT